MLNRFVLVAIGAVERCAVHSSTSSLPFTMSRSSNRVHSYMPYLSGISTRVESRFHVLGAPFTLQRLASPLLERIHVLWPYLSAFASTSVMARNSPLPSRPAYLRRVI